MTRKVITSSIAAACLAGSAWAQTAPAPGANAPGQSQAPRTCATQGVPGVPAVERLADGTGSR